MGGPWPSLPQCRISFGPCQISTTRVREKKGLCCKMGHAFRGKSGERSCSRPTKPHSRWRPSTFAHAVVRPASGRFATWSRRGSRRRPWAGQSGAFETRARFVGIPCYRILDSALVLLELSLILLLRRLVMRSSGVQGRCKLRSRRLQRQSIHLRGGSMLSNFAS